MKKVKIYVAGPLGFSEAGRDFYNNRFIPMLKEIGFEVLDPWVLTDPKLIAQATLQTDANIRANTWRTVNKLIGENNAEAIKESDIIVAILDGTDVDSGTASEIGFGAGRGIPVIGYRGDFRLSADNEGSIVNLQVEYFIHLNGGEIEKTMKKLKYTLQNWYRKLSV